MPLSPYAGLVRRRNRPPKDAEHGFRWAGVIARVVAFWLAGLVPLVLLTYFSLHLGVSAVDRQVNARASSTASLSASVVDQELRGLSDIVSSYASRPQVIAALSAKTMTAYDRQQIRFHLSELVRARAGIAVAFATDLSGRLLDVVPPTPSIVGKSYSFRDWYRGVTRTRRPYVSEAYVTAARGHPRVVAAAMFVRVPAHDAAARPVAILVAAYGLGHLQAFVDRLARAQGVDLMVTDQRGVVVAAPSHPSGALVSRARDERVAAALRGRSGTATVSTPAGRTFSAYAPVPSLGWTVTASLPADTAFAASARLRSTVLPIAGVLALIFLLGAVVLVRTLAERRRAEQAANRQASINKSVLDASVDGIALFDLNGDFVLENPAAVALRAQLFGDLSDLGKNLVDPAPLSALQAAIARDPAYSGSAQLEFVSGHTLKVVTAPVRDQEGELIGRLNVGRDVTDELQVERLKSELVATVSHELRTPLAGIVGFAELLAERDYDPETRQRYLETIRKEAGRLTDLINKFLDVQRIEEGHFTLEVTRFDLSEVVRDAVKVYAGQSDKHTLELSFPPEPVEVAGDRDRIVQVLGNLISNAIKYSPDGGSVRLTTATLGDSVRVTIADEGIGIPADQHGRIFEKFFRVDDPATRGIGGTGLGLALCEQIIEAHGGRLGFTSVPGSGSIFWFELPAVGRDTNLG